ncbi:MAG TPA: transcription-repair coupling factor [Arenicellales bacterium]|nr:transcription-repair coupling factor [Arenicellales bacterium]
MTTDIFDPGLPGTGGVLRWNGVFGSGFGLAVASVAAHGRPVVVAAPDMRAAARIESQLRFYLDTERNPLHPFPDWECLPYDNFSPHPDLVSQRLLTLHRLPGLRRGVVVLPVSGLMQRLPPVEYVHSRTFDLRRGDTVDAAELSARLQKSGYHHVGQVLSPGEFSVRGSVIDIFPMGSRQPFRIDLFGDDIDSIRYFDPESQRSVEQVEALQLLPAAEFPLDEEAVRGFRQRFRSRFEGDPQKSSIYRDVSRGHAPAGVEFYLPLFFDHTATLFDYLPAGTVLVHDDRLASACETNHSEIQDRYELAKMAGDNPVLPPEALYLDPGEVSAAVDDFSRIENTVYSEAEGLSLGTAAPPRFTVSAHANEPFAPLLEFVNEFEGRVLMVAESAGRREVLQGVLRDHGIRTTEYSGWSEFLAGEARVGITVDRMEDGLLLRQPSIAVITEAQVFGERVAQRRRRDRARRDPDTIIRSLAELEVNDPVVHEEHGVGRYRGLATLSVDGNETEFLTIEYHGGDKLYIPILSLHAVSRYVGASPETAPLHKLGSEQWVRARRKAQERAYDVAAELLETQALRNSRAGFACREPDDAYRTFCEGFMFEETPDQAQVIDDVIADMESSEPMDRLVCGDVGFGKTEIALRAAFLAVSSGRQVAVLVPTTLLAQQHFENFSDRFADFPVEVELLSRFRSRKELEKTLSRAAEGKVDILIGTHRVLQKDVKMPNLGLVIIDEEHRFGVRQKERLKQLRAEIDVLTLTATPIPRTLNTALSGLRDISIIGTPPKARLSVKTFVREWNSAVIREACLREIRRGGQVYFLHNQVRTIDKYYEELADLVPEAEIQVAHGQLPERELERIMSDFYHQRFNILVCSTIIESGIDVPTANTIIINRADRFGLAQLHQLRGRVGRSHHQAYAYLLTPPRRALTGDALKRLEAIESLEDLGVGFALASHDLEIRGAGEILGENQSGTIDEVGFTMYSEFLNRAIETLKSQGEGERAPAAEEARPPEINLNLPALLPDSYLNDVHQRLVIYKRISSARDVEELNELQAETIDRFGLMPEPAKTLFRTAEHAVSLKGLGIERINLGPAGGRVEFSADADIDPLPILRMIESDPARYRMEGSHTLLIRAEMPDEESRFAVLKEIAAGLGVG